MGFEPSGYAEVFARTADSGGKTKMIPIFPGESESDYLLDPEDVVVNKSKMMVRYM
jgi:hypothetical protein